MRDTIRIILISYFLLIAVFMSDCDEQKLIEEGYKKLAGYACQQLGLPGICEALKNCEIAVELLKRKNSHGLKICGYEGSQQIVCCPQLSHRPPLEETTTIDRLIRSGDHGISKRSSTEGDNVNNKGGLKIKRKSEEMCEKIYTDNKIKPEIPLLLNSNLNATVGQFPHAVALGFEDSEGQMRWSCGASLISSRFLLTVAHCFICIGCSDPKKARLGTIDVKDSRAAQDVDVKNVTPHPDFNPVSKHNDIAIVELVQDVQMSKFVYPACLYTETDDPLGLQVIGWPFPARDDPKSLILQYASTRAVPVNECNAKLVEKIPRTSIRILETHICTTSDACVVSGTPLQIMKKEGGYAIVGIVSFGVGCRTKIPDVYTRVAKYLDWIEPIVWPEPTN